jgi:peptidoglycan/xylan/chitin deacetylase (PgdA/CDA1 family)
MSSLRIQWRSSVSTHKPDEKIKIAVTVDDFVMFDGIPEPAGSDAVSVTRAVAKTLTDHNLHGVYGFTHTHRLAEEPQLMGAFESWVEAGHHLGNHTHNHATIAWMSGETYCADIDLAEKYIGPMIDAAPQRYFRYASDMCGAEEQKRGQVEDHLRERGYKNAPITAWFSDFAWIVPYFRAKTNDDHDALEMLRSTYVQAALDQLTAHSRSAKEMFGGDVPLIWLIHGTPITVDTLDTILSEFADLGVEFIDLPEAMRHPANFGMPPVETRFANHLQRYAFAAGLTPPEVSPELMHQVMAASPLDGYDTVPYLEEQVLKRQAARVGAEFKWAWAW